MSHSNHHVSLYFYCSYQTLSNPSMQSLYLNLGQLFWPRISPWRNHLESPISDHLIYPREFSDLLWVLSNNVGRFFIFCSVVILIFLNLFVASNVVVKDLDILESLSFHVKQLIHNWKHIYFIYVYLSVQWHPIPLIVWFPFLQKVPILGLFYNLLQNHDCQKLTVCIPDIPIQ